MLTEVADQKSEAKSEKEVEDDNDDDYSDESKQKIRTITVDEKDDLEKYREQQLASLRLLVYLFFVRCQARKIGSKSFQSHFKKFIDETKNEQNEKKLALKVGFGLVLDLLNSSEGEKDEQLLYDYL